MVDFSQGDVKIDGVKIHYYRSQGGKQTIIMLHGATDSGLCWARTAQELAERYDAVIYAVGGCPQEGQHERLVVRDSHRCTPHLVQR